MLDMDRIKGDIDKRNNSISDTVSIEGKVQKYEELQRKLSGQISKLVKSVEFYRETHNCPTCDQEIDGAFKQKVIENKNDRLKEFQKACEDLSSKQKEASDRLASIREVQREITTLNIEYQNKNASVSGINTYISKLQKENERLLSLDGTVTDEQIKVQSLEKAYNDLLTSRDEMIDTRHLYEVASDLLKDSGIKTKIIRQYLPVMNKLINKYLGSMDFFVNFNLDENFKEVIKSRYRDEFEYNSFSQGQKFRIDMALLLTWREVSRKKNSTNTNILILDEVFDSSLDAGGTEDFMKLLRILSKKTHIFVISHKPDVISDRFDRHLKVEIKNNFSIIN